MAVKKILICGDYQTPDEPFFGGVSRSVYSTVQGLVKIGSDYEFHVYTLSKNIKKTSVRIEGNLTVHSIAFPLKNLPILIPQQLHTLLIKRIIRQIRPDLVHAHGTGKDYAAPTIGWNPEKSVITVHGVTYEESKHWTGIKGAYHRATGRRIERQILSKAQSIIAVSPYVKRMIQPYTEADISVIFNPVERKFLAVKKSILPQRILFVGGIEERKGLTVLIEALALVTKQFPHVDLHIIGCVRKMVYYHKLQKLIEMHGLEQNVRFQGNLSDQDLMEEYSQAEIFILPSYEESQGIVILEALATGTPVIATRAGGIPDVVQDGINGLLVNCGDYHHMAQTIISLLADPRKCEKLASAGKGHAAVYLPDTIARQHLDVYERLLH